MLWNRDVHPLQSARGSASIPTGQSAFPPAGWFSPSMLLLALVLSAMVHGQAVGAAPMLDDAAPAPSIPQSSETSLPAETPSEAELDPLALEGDLVAGPKPPRVPDDPCLAPLYKDWHELSQDARTDRPDRGFVEFRIVLDRAGFTLTLEGLRRDGSVEVLYRSACGLGDVETPTPEGRFTINHVYCYPDVLFFSESGDRIPLLYNGFFAPLLLCDEEGRCERFRDLGIHGFNPSAHPEPSAARIQTCGAVSSGCIRVPDPCKLKSELIRAVGIGPPKRNDRGTYHWLDKPVAVIIRGEYPGTADPFTLGSLVEKGLIQVQNGVKSLLGVFGR